MLECNYFSLFSLEMSFTNWYIDSGIIYTNKYGSFQWLKKGGGACTGIMPRFLTELCLSDFTL